VTGKKNHKEDFEHGLTTEHTPRIGVPYNIPEGGHRPIQSCTDSLVSFNDMGQSPVRAADAKGSPSKVPRISLAAYMPSCSAITQADNEECSSFKLPTAKTQDTDTAVFANGRPNSAMPTRASMAKSRVKTQSKKKETRFRF